MKFKVLLRNGKICDDWSEEMDTIINELRKRVSYLHDLPVMDIINFLDRVGTFWQNEFKKEFGMSLNHLIETLRKENLITTLDTALRKKEALDGFVKFREESVFYHAQPRGLAVHWVAGNVPLLGLFSVFQTLLTKNVSLVKASSKSYKDMVKLLDSFSKVNTEKIKGSDILKSITIIIVDRNDKENLEKMSMAADTRIAWGGQEAVDSLMILRKRFSTVDIINGPKYSYALIGKEALEGDVKKLAQRLAVDVSVFDQYACSSPHTVFVEKGGKIQPLEFAKELADQLSVVNRMMLPKGNTDPKKVIEILELRAKYEFSGEVFSSENTDWTVIYSEEEGLAQPCFSRVVFVRPIKDVDAIESYNNRNKQTLGLEMSLNRRLKLADKTTLYGVDRCPRIGTMSFFDSPWDGEFALDKMVRWVTCYG